MSLSSKFGDMDIYLGADHSQLEIRVLAQMSKDPLLLKLIKEGGDIHSKVGHELTGQPVEQIKKDRDTRTAIKGIHFGIIYGLQAESLYYKLKADAVKFGQDFKMSQKQVTKLYNAYFEKFAGVKVFIDYMHEFGQEHEYVDTLFGFRREIALHGDETRNTFWANQAVNSPIQGTAHELMLIAMAILEIKKKTYELLQRYSMEVHDSFYCFVKLSQLVEAYKQFIQLMEEEVLKYVKLWWPEVKWEVPLAAEAKAGFRLGVMAEYKGQPVEQFIDEWCEKNKKFEIKMKEDMKKSIGKVV